MAQMPNPSVNPIVGAGGFMRPEWVRYFSELQAHATAATTPTPAPTPVPTPAPTPAPTPPPADDAQVMLAAKVMSTRPAPPPPVDAAQSVLAMQVFRRR